MLDSWSQVSEIIRAQRMRFVTVLQRACTFQNKINFFFTVVENTLARAWASTETSAKRETLRQNSIVRVTCTEEWLVMAGSRGEISFRFAQTGQIPMQPRGINTSILGRESYRDQQRQTKQSPVSFPPRGVLTLFPHLRTLVYHRICLTQIEIFRLIGIYFVLRYNCLHAKVLRATLNPSQPLSRKE